MPNRTTNIKDARAIASILAERIEDLAEFLVGEKPTSRSRDEIRFYPRGGLVITIAGRRRGLWCSHGDGGIGGDALDLVKHLLRCTTAEAITWSCEYLGRSEHPRAAGVQSVASGPRPPTRDKVELARRVWIEARDPAGTPAEAYLRSRGLSLQPGAPLRYHPACPRHSETLPAMISLMTDPVTGEDCGVHRTFLRSVGGGKADGQAKMMLGAAGVIRLVPDDEITLGIGICEGIETGLAIVQLAGWSPVWACGSAGAIAKFPSLEGLEVLTVFVDLDDAGAGMNAAQVVADRWQNDGKSVAIAKPPRGSDWHDALRVREAVA